LAGSGRDRPAFTDHDHVTLVEKRSQSDLVTRSLSLNSHKQGVFVRPHGPNRQLLFMIQPRITFIKVICAQNKAFTNLQILQV